ncbi:hypothetical protein C463_02491 [Halorubrum californiense DSM 19288]|uniref:Uncharacterized protein n=1 Tax=Halorubrum californiense DSM 19288 TaxID=1227465 RepID=M0EIK1_9EURY|nr:MULTISPECIES: hypothetical protein [Halorubrum]ELZ47596.1 hypothetical protein C463_02491 [Halorubrum californiense DSM 19288]TKX72160.1 hypothetical protein EXE40_04770 [Halorubrum sp. GN11GM_10-3_MGM]
MSLRSRLLGSALLVAGAAMFAATVSLVPTVPPESGADAVSLIAPTPYSFIATPPLLAVGSVLLIGGAAALAGADLSARATLLAPALGGIAAFALVVGVVSAPAAILPGLAEADALAAAVAGPPGTIATGAVVGAAVAPVIRATTTEDTVALLAGSVLLLAALAAGASDPISLVTGGVGGAVAVGLLWAVDPERWRP